jgi:hypothetical protein
MTRKAFSLSVPTHVENIFSSSLVVCSKFLQCHSGSDIPKIDSTYIKIFGNIRTRYISILSYVHHSIFCISPRDMNFLIAFFRFGILENIYPHSSRIDGCSDAYWRRFLFCVIASGSAFRSFSHISEARPRMRKGV